MSTDVVTVQVDGAAPSTPKTTISMQMKAIVALSTLAAVLAVPAAIGYWTFEITATVAGSEVNLGRFLSYDRLPCTIACFAATFSAPTAIVTPLAMYTHMNPDFVLFASKQMTDQLRAKFANPFKMK